VIASPTVPLAGVAAWAFVVSTASMNTTAAAQTSRFTRGKLLLLAYILIIPSFSITSDVLLHQ
jgi:hypothetical protein